MLNTHCSSTETQDLSLSDAQKAIETVSPTIVEPVKYEGEPQFKWAVDDLEKLLLWSIDNNASDIAIQSNSPIWARIYGQWLKVTDRPVQTDELERMLSEMTRTPAASAELKSGKDKDFPYEIKRNRFDMVRFRCNATSIRAGWSQGMSIIMRSIPSQPPLLADLNPEPVIMEHAFPLSGLVLVTGVMGSGKTTLLAAITRAIVETMPRNVLTYEAPIEFDLMSFQNARGFCLQTQVPEHLESFDIAPRNAARRAADVILFGESRDLETLRGMIEAAEIGVAAYSTVHTRSVAETPSRIINLFPAYIQNQIATTMLASLRLIIQQRLVPKVGGGRIALREILAFNGNIRDELIKTPINELIPKIQKYTADQGQTMLDDAKIKFHDGLITKETLDLLRYEFI